MQYGGIFFVMQFTNVSEPNEAQSKKKKSLEKNCFANVVSD